jgi:Mn-dependent DtxR family transcriptional regulator
VREGTVLQQLLSVLGDGGLHTTDEAARRLKVGEPLVAAMVDNLERAGYLVGIPGGCSMTCGGCGAAEACGVAGNGSAPARLLALTAKGRLAASAA